MNATMDGMLIFNWLLFLKFSYNPTFINLWSFYSYKTAKGKDHRLIDHNLL
jgi:hypothetical protein